MNVCFLGENLLWTQASEIMFRLETERESVEANKRLIELYEGKIKQVISVPGRFAQCENRK